MMRCPNHIPYMSTDPFSCHQPRQTSFALTSRSHTLFFLRGEQRQSAKIHITTRVRICYTIPTIPLCPHFSSSKTKALWCWSCCQLRCRIETPVTRYPQAVTTSPRQHRTLFRSHWRRLRLRNCHRKSVPLSKSERLQVPRLLYFNLQNTQNLFL